MKDSLTVFCFNNQSPFLHVLEEKPNNIHYLSYFDFNFASPLPKLERILLLLSTLNEILVRYSVLNKLV